jgi:hypothetical protein
VSSELPAFAAALSKLNLKEVDLAVAMLWYEDHVTSKAARSASELAELLDGHALTSGVNRSRLGNNLRSHPDTVTVPGTSTFRIKLASKDRLDEKYGPLLTTKVVVVRHTFLPESQTKGTRPYLEKLAWQINGSYESGFYDGCAVLCRRLTESLLIEAFEHTGKGAEIRNGPDYKQLGDIIGIAKSGQHIRLSRNTRSALDDIKAVGDTAAHDRTYITTKTDLDQIGHEFRRTTTELMALAKIHPK